MQTEFGQAVESAQVKKKIQNDGVMGFWEEVFKNGDRTLNHGDETCQKYLLNMNHKPEGDLHSHELQVVSLRRG
ncbi:MAG TPA: hypothetical protein VGO47_05195 [Chlamydiales bacterium]|jgi:hypothetical protein|nr:hypothetical protein [Chlamydiales bacterium]